MKIHASTYGVSTIAIRKLAFVLDQMNWQEVLKLLRDIFAYVDVQYVVYTSEENGVHALSTEGDAEFYADDQIERYSEEENREFKTNFTRDSKSCQPTCDKRFSVLREQGHNNRLIDHYLQNQPKELINYVKEFDFQYSDFTDEEMIPLIDMFLDSRDDFSHYKVDVSKTRQKLQKFHVTLKPNVELKRQRPSKVHLQLKEKQEKLLTQLTDADIIGEMGDDDEMESLFVNPVILIHKNDNVKLVIDARYLKSVTDLANFFWPPEPVQMITTRVNGKIFSVIDFSCAYHQVPFSPETQKLTSFIIGGKQYTYTRAFYGLCGLPSSAS